MYEIITLTDETIKDFKGKIVVVLKSNETQYCIDYNTKLYQYGWNITCVVERKENGK